MTSTGETIKILRAELGVPQRWLADQVGVSQQTVARWESGDEVPTKYLRDLAMALGCSVVDLVEGGEPHSYISRYVAKRGGRFEGKLDNSELLFGTLRLRFLPSARELLNPQPESEDQWPRPFEREYAISNGERRRLAQRLDDRGEHFPSWFIFDSLDNRIVFVNRAQLESVELVHDDIENAPPFAHQEIYEALSDRQVQDVLRGQQPADIFDADEAPYSRATIERCFEVAEDLGGIEELLNQIDYVQAETIDGRRLELFSDPETDVFNELSLLAIQLDGYWSKDMQPVDDWLVELGGERWERSSQYRLGSLRVIEAPLLKYREAQRLEHEDDAATLLNDEEDQDG
jgi:transcriptional regulator with XRE-family HTH domain